MTHTATLRAARMPRGFVALAVALLLALSSAPAVQALGKLLPVIVSSSDAGTAAELTRDAGGEVVSVLPIVDGVSARVPESRLADLKARAHVVPDRQMRVTGSSYGGALVNAYPGEVGATRLWDGDVAGEGVAVALVDTGVSDHPDVADRVVATANLTNERSPYDTYGHGTFQAGLIAGNGASSDGRYVGVAPEANLVSIKVAGRDGSTSLGQVLFGVQLVHLAAEAFGVRVMLLALDSESPLPPELDPLSIALRRTWAAGVVVVVPAGNDGAESGAIASPGEDPVLLTAASVNDMGTPDPSDDLVSDFSSRGPTRWGDEKPDVAAPGQHLVSLRATGSTVDEENPSARVEEAYFKGSGTSMAAAVTAGAAALLLQARPALSPDEVKALLMANATAIPAGDEVSVGAGVVDAAAAAADDTELPVLPPMPEEPEIGFGNGNGKGRGLGGWVREGRRWVWDARTWAARSWVARSWAARQWLEENWEARSWAARSWAARTWAARTWAARQWRARSWASRSWASRSWAARQWVARQWRADEWTARQWRAGEWSARQWRSLEWDARSWSSRTWSSRQWKSSRWA